MPLPLSYLATLLFILSTATQAEKPSPSPSSGVLKNGGFEKNLADWNSWGAVKDTQAHSGKTCARITNQKITWSGADQILLIPENTERVEVSGWIKTENVVRGKEAWEQARISIEFLDAGGSLTGGYPPVTGQAVGNTDWTFYKRNYSLRGDAQQLKIQVALGNATGSALFDDLAVHFIGEQGKELQAGRLKGPQDGGRWYDFPQPEKQHAGHYVDWSDLLDAPAGKHGVLLVKKGKLVFADGTPVRFWGSNLVGGRVFVEHDKADSLALRLSRMGCNMLRLHHMDAPWAKPNIFGNKKTTRKLDSLQLDRLDYLIAALAKKGIYTFLDILVHREFTEADGISKPLPDRGGKQVGFFDPQIIDLQKEFASQLLNHKNVYTGKRYAEDPVIAASEFINESTIYTNFSGDKIQGHYRSVLEKIWEKSGNQGSLPVFGLNWQGHRANLTVKKGAENSEKGLNFLRGLEDSYYSNMKQHFRELGVKYPLAGSNFPPPILLSLQSNAALDFTISNEYWDHPQLWKIGGDWKNVLWAPLDNQSQLLNPKTNLIHEKSWFKVKDKPLLITEWNHCWPNEYQLEGVPLMAAYGALQGWDGILQFDFGHDAVGMDRQRNIRFSNDPVQVAQWVIAAPMFLRGDVQTASGVVREGIRTEQVDRLPSYSDFLEQNPYLPFITRVEKDFDGPSVGNPEDWKHFHDRESGTTKSQTGELLLDSKKGRFSVNTPRIQGVMGFGHTSGIEKDFPAARIKLAGMHSSVFLVSKDGLPLDSSKDFLVVATASARMSGQKYNSSRTKLLDIGKLPIQLQKVQGNIIFKSVNRQKNLRGFPLSPDGKRGRPLKIKQTEGGISFNLSGGSSLVYEFLRD